MIKKRLSVIIPTHNNGPELENAILSILNQDTNGIDIAYEILVVNDGTDSLLLPELNRIVESYESCLLLHNAGNSGPAGARNFGLNLATGDIIGFLDADDTWPINKLRILLPYLDNLDVEVAGGKIKYIFEGNQPAINILFEDNEQRVTHVHLGALLIKKSVFDRGIKFDESLRFSEDVDWWFQIREQEIGIQLVEETTLNYVVHGNNMSVNKSLQELQMLKVLHNSSKRRSLLEQVTHLPKINDFRINREDPLISIVIPLYNGRNLIDKSINSVVNQTYNNWELIIVDDGSTDDGVQYVQSKYPFAKIITQVNAGVANARNTGIKHSSGEFLAFSDQDAEWLPTKLQEQWEVLKNNAYCAFVTCNQKYQFAPGAKLPVNFKANILVEEHRSFIPSSLLIRKHALLEIGMFDESLEVSSDVDLIRKLRKANFKEYNVEKLLLNKWYHTTNASIDVPSMVKELLSILHKQTKGR